MSESEDISEDFRSMQSIKVTATYNLARIQECMCQFDLAENLYKGILRERSTYVHGTLQCVGA